MPATPVIAIFDIGKTNKKLFLFDDQYRIVWEKSANMDETKDEDGDVCEDLQKLTQWMIQSAEEVLLLQDFQVQAINFSGYGASFVHLDNRGIPVTPLYNYLKSFPIALSEQFYQHYGPAPEFSVNTASPVLGNLNSGLQLYYLKYCKPELFNKIHCSLHLPQYLSFLITKKYYSDITSIGCHTALWNFREDSYHQWVFAENIIDKLAPIVPSDQLITTHWKDRSIICGTGLHDSSSALIPYLTTFKESFVLISTGTWCISLNPFNHTSLTIAELNKDCLCYMEHHGKPVKASRLFAGNEHEEQVKRLALHFNKASNYYKTVIFDPDMAGKISKHFSADQETSPDYMMQKSAFAKRNLLAYTNFDDAYHQLMHDLVAQQVKSTNMVLKNCPVKKIFVDGGFGKNKIYMNLLAAAYPGVEVYASSVSQASAIGAALAIHGSWNHQPANLKTIDLTKYNTALAIK